MVTSACQLPVESFHFSRDARWVRGHLRLGERSPTDYFEGSFLDIEGHLIERGLK